MTINDYIYVRLTEAGEAAWKRHWENVSPQGVPIEIRKQAEASDGRLRFQLWEAMHTFGPDCFNGINRIPFVGNKIEFK